jgi:alkanesulfonate monooxygenase SsuD/methylene tetrahydromethanopterin reductase-like flavin-dependent oxidoreductase (luciferase family)
MEVGVGTGWQKEEFLASGVDWRRRGPLLTDTIAACRALWTESPASFRSESFSFDRLVPEAAQPGGIPVCSRARSTRVTWSASAGSEMMDLAYSPPEVPREGAEAAQAARWPRAAASRCRETQAVRGADGRPDLRSSLTAIPLREAGGRHDRERRDLAFTGPSRPRSSSVLARVARVT